MEDLILVARIQYDSDGAMGASDDAAPDEEYMGLEVYAFADWDDLDSWLEDPESAAPIAYESLWSIEASSDAEYLNELAMELAVACVSSYQDQTGTHKSTAPAVESRRPLQQRKVEAEEVKPRYVSGYKVEPMLKDHSFTVVDWYRARSGSGVMTLWTVEVEEEGLVYFQQDDVWSSKYNSMPKEKALASAQKKMQNLLDSGNWHY